MATVKPFQCCLHVLPTGDITLLWSGGTVLFSFSPLCLWASYVLDIGLMTADVRGKQVHESSLHSSAWVYSYSWSPEVTRNSLDQASWKWNGWRVNARGRLHLGLSCPHTLKIHKMMRATFAALVKSSRATRYSSTQIVTSQGIYIFFSWCTIKWMCKKESLIYPPFFSNCIFDWWNIIMRSYSY